MLLRLFLLLPLGLAAETLRFAVMGDSGTGDVRQQAVAERLLRRHREQPLPFVLLLGDNIYENGEPADFEPKFKRMYRDLMREGVEFHATLGNHDRRSARSRKGMAQVEDDAFGFLGRQDEYVYIPVPFVRLIALNSDAWLEELEAGRRPEARIARLRSWLAQSGQYRWNIAFFHHPLYSYVTKNRLGMKRGHGGDEKLRPVLEPLLVEGKVDVVFSGHDHFYQKIRPQNGIHYFVSGAGGQIRPGVDKRHPNVEFAAEELHFLEVEMDESRLLYTPIPHQGRPLHPPRAISRLPLPPRAR